MSQAQAHRTLYLPSPGESPLTIVSDKAIRQQTAKTEVLDARDGKLIRTLPAVYETSVVPFVSRDWLYSAGWNDRTLYRQRLQ